MGNYTTNPITKDTHLTFVFKKKDSGNGKNVIKYIAISFIIVVAVVILISTLT